jgi:small subunit ribosomal protein S16
VSVRIRLQRKGAKHMAFFRIVAADSRSPRDGRFIEQLGYYDPLRDPPDIKVDTEKVIGWLGKGAQPTETVRALLARIGILETWHEVRRGKSLDELRHIEDEARKRIEAQAAMDKRKRAAEVEEKVEEKAKAEVEEKVEEKPKAEEKAKAEAEEKGEEKPEEKAEPEEGAEPEEVAPPEDSAAEAGGEKPPAEPAAEEPAADTQEEAQAAGESEGVKPEAAGGDEAADAQNAPSGEKQSK